MSRIYEIADEYVDRFAQLHPVAATAIGIPGHDARMTDYSPVGDEAMLDLQRRTRMDLSAVRAESARDRVALEAMLERLSLEIELQESDEHLRSLSILGSPLQAIRGCFDLMPRDTEEHWKNIATRLHFVPQGLAGYRSTLEEGLERGVLAAQRQARECGVQCEIWSGSSTDTGSFFDSLLEAYDASDVSGSGSGSTALRAEIEGGAGVAAEAYASFGNYLTERYLPEAEERDPVGPDRYQLGVRIFNGLEIDLEQTYHWGWDELYRIERELVETADRISPGASVEEAKELLENDPHRAVEGVEEFRRWMQEFQDSTVSAMDGTHFDIPERVKRIEAMIAPPGGALAMYYTGPSEDFSRPGRTWYPTGGKTRFPLWREVSIAYHEGVPGHHLQIGTTKHLGEELSRFQRLLGGVSGYSEGWALYAERLMAELGYLESPDAYMGMLASQALRSARVVVDIGMHMELRIPDAETYHGGEVWTPELALPFLEERSHFPADFLASEVTRYLGIPGQAISYKVGERRWLTARDQSRDEHGDEFDLKDWHARALDLGPMGLAQMERELSS